MTGDDPHMTRTRVLATSLTVVLAGALTALPQTTAQARPQAVSVVSATGDGGPNHYLSTPPDPFAAKAAQPHTAQRPKAPPTRGTVTGQVTGPNGTPIPN